MVQLEPLNSARYQKEIISIIADSEFNNMKNNNIFSLNIARSMLRSVLSEASFMVPTYFGASTWVQHAPFAFFLIEAVKPRSYVELGSHNGYSYFAVCQAVKTYDLHTRCFAVDTWQGDEHAGFYDTSVFGTVESYQAANYAAFSELKRMTFDEALLHFEDGSIDILHIDGRHFYEDVRHDFLSWLPKLSDSGIVLIHDTQVRDKGFGVYRLWAEIVSTYPTFEFHHGHGLGVVAIGQNIPDGLKELFNAKGNPQAVEMIRLAYERIGASLDHYSKLAKQARKGDRKSRFMRSLKKFFYSN